MMDVQDRVAEDGPVPSGARLCASVTDYAPALRHYFARRAPAAEVDDLVQDVFVRLQASHPRSPVIDPQAYLFGAARRVLASSRRRLSRQGWRLRNALADAVDLTSELSPERIVGARQDYARAMAAVDDLPPRAAAAFRMHRFEELSYAGIASRMGISRESVKELLRRATVRVGGARENFTPDIPPRAMSERH